MKEPNARNKAIGGRNREHGLLACVVVLFSLLGIAAHAQETVIIPYDASKPISEQQPDQRYVPYERFLQLWDAAKAHKRSPVPPDAPREYTLDNGQHDVVIDGKTLTLTSTLDFHTFGNDPVEIPLDFGKRNWLAATLDGSPASFENGRLLVTEPAAHRLVLTSTETFDVSSQKNWSLHIPQTPAGRLAVTLPNDSGSVTFDGEAAILETIEKNRKIAVRPLAGAADISVAFDFQERRSQAVATTPAFAKLTHHITTGTAWESIETTAEFDPQVARISRFTLFLPPDLQPTDIQAHNLHSWKLTANADHNGRSRLDIFPNSPVSRKYTVTLTSERPVSAGKRTSPVITVDARRMDAEIALKVDPSVELSSIDPGDARQTALNTFVPPRADGAITYETTIREIKREATIDAIYQVNRSKIDLIASIRLTTKETSILPLTHVTLGIPADFDVETVQSAALRDWWRDLNGLHLRLQPRPNDTALVLYLVKQFDTPPKDLDLQPIHVEGFQNATGEAVIAAHVGDDTMLELTGAKEVAPGSVAKEFTILPPLERKRAFIFTQPDFRGKVALAPRPLRMSAAWVTHLQAHEGWLAWQTKTRFVVREGSTRKVTFSLPKKTPEARVTGPEVRETSSTIDAGRRVYTVALQNDLVSATDITIDLEQSAAEPVAGIEFFDLERQDGYIAAENVSDYEMTLQPRGLEAAQPTDLPFVPPLTTRASVYRALPAWTLGVTLDRLEKTGSRAAFVSWVEITSAIREDGTEWNRAVYHLQNRSLQFLPVRLPAGAELVTARVAGENTRADSGEIDGKSVLLIPLIKTRPGDISYDVELVYRRFSGAKKLRWLASRELDDPELPGVTVERTLWNLRLPEKYPLLGNPDRSGNMETVIAEVNKAEKLSGMLEELKSLGSIARSSGEGSYVKKKAAKSFDELARQIEGDAQWSDSDDPKLFQIQTQKEVETSGKKSQREISQSGEASRRRSEIKAELEAERKKLAETASQLESAAPTETQSAVSAWNDNAAYQQKSTAINNKATFKSDLEAGGKSGSQLLLNDNIALEQSLLSPETDMSRSESGVKDLSKETLTNIAKFTGSRTEEKSGQAAFRAARGNAILGNKQASIVPAPLATAVVDEKAAALEQLRLPGRVSLNADFPLEGREYHFKKLKSNARLVFRVASEPVMTKLVNWAGFAGLALILWLILHKWKKMPTHTLSKGILPLFMSKRSSGLSIEK